MKKSKRALSLLKWAAMRGEIPRIRAQVTHLNALFAILIDTKATIFRLKQHQRRLNLRIRFSHLAKPWTWRSKTSASSFSRWKIGVSAHKRTDCSKSDSRWQMRWLLHCPKWMEPVTNPHQSSRALTVKETDLVFTRAAKPNAVTKQQALKGKCTAPIWSTLTESTTNYHTHF